jgi:hypothetical protein
MEKPQKKPIYFYCELCDFKCPKARDYSRHVLTRKHKVRSDLNKFTHTDSKGDLVYIIKYSCKNCGKIYKARNSLWYHEKKCAAENCENEIIENDYSKPSINEPNKNTIITQNDGSNELVKELLKQNNEFKQLIIELASKPTTTITNNNNTTNNKFSLNVFLNEQCKDAVNIMDFVKSLQIELSELEAIGKLGYAEGISKIFIKGLKELDIYKRPIHCSDLKREVLYIKDQDSWEKDNDDKSKIKSAIKQIEHKNIKNIPEWINKNPDSKYADSPKNEQYMKIISNSMGGSTNEEDEKNFNKIIKKVANEVVIDKII